MSSTDDMWDALARRAALSKFSGVTSDDDDSLANPELREALLNPNRAAGGGGAGAGGPGMMPPMMMGGMGGAGGGAAGGAGGGLGSSAGPAATGPVGPAGMGGGMPPLAPAPTLSAAAGGPGAGEALEEPAMPDLGGAGGGGMPDLGSGGGGMPDPGAGAGSGAGAEAGAGAGAGTKPADGFAVDPTQLKTLADKWEALAAQLRGMPPQPESDLGLVEVAARPQQALNQQLNTWNKGAADEFDAIVGRLHEALSSYSSADDSGVAEAKKAGAAND